MKPADYQRYTEAVVAWAQRQPAVLGLVAVGSMARRDREPDEWSDHDFWLVTEPRAAEGYRTEWQWLPDARTIALAYRETAHGVKVVYDSGHLVEYAVFTPDELAVAKANEYRVLLDRERIAERMLAVRADTQGAAPDPEFAAGQLLTQLLVAVARERRGERTSARAFLGHAVESLTHLVAAHLPTDHPDLLDDIDPRRRFELAFPALAAEIDAAVTRDPEPAATALLALAERELRERFDGWPGRAVIAVRGVLDGRPMGISSPERTGR